MHEKGCGLLRSFPAYVPNKTLDFDNKIATIRKRDYQYNMLTLLIIISLQSMAYRKKMRVDRLLEEYTPPEVNKHTIIFIISNKAISHLYFCEQNLEESPQKH